MTALRAPFPGRLRHLRPRLQRAIVATCLDEHDALLRSFRVALQSSGIPAIAQIAPEVDPPPPPLARRRLA